MFELWSKHNESQHTCWLRVNDASGCILLFRFISNSAASSLILTQV